MATNAKKKTTSKQRTATKKSNATKTSSRNNPAIKRSTSPKKSPAKKSSSKKSSTESMNINYTEIILWITIAFSLLIFVGNLGYGGSLGRSASSLILSAFGLVGYLMPFIIIAAVGFCLSNIHNMKAMYKLIYSLLFIVLISTLLELFSANGGSIGNVLVSILTPAIGTAGTVIVVIILMIIDYILVFEKSAFADMKKAGSSGKQAYSNAKSKISEKAEALSAEASNVREAKRRDRKIEGVSFNTTLLQPEEEEHASKKAPKKEERKAPRVSQDELFRESDGGFSLSGVTLTPAKNIETPKENVPLKEAAPVPEVEIEAIADTFMNDEAMTGVKRKKNTKKNTAEIEAEKNAFEEMIEEKKVSEKKTSKPIDVKSSEQTSMKMLPPFELLKKGNSRINPYSSDSNELRFLLGNTLETFGVEIDGEIDYTTGPSVTRFEFKPGPGVKVAKIVGLADDIKLSLAATDIRIEAPIPGKNKVGIEVPNKEKSSVLLRDLLESKEFENSKSKVTYAVGMDIGGDTIVSDIAKMPHLLVAGATGSGKSVFINSLIMSILYKATPDEVKFIMIDPKVVELSVYNGLPHLLIPVVTDPKKAAGALNWAVAEMTKRYQAFAREGVRDIKSFNAKAILPVEDPEDTKLEKMSQIVVIVDELADLMMVAPKDVEEAICRLAQLARAAGIHLVLATQRPSVNVITGLIKANMPSRIALSVTSGIDSRTIIDMNGAEKLLGYGDMLFYPTGYTKPVRIQGAYVSDEEIQRVVAFIKENNEEVTTSSDITEAIENHSIGNTVQISNSDNNERDSYFAEAGRLIIDKDKASIGMLQRQFKIGFNRAARIMDQLHECGIVGPEEGTKPRKILMNASEFEQYLNEN